MATKKYISLSNLTSFLNNLKNLFATKAEISAKSDKGHVHSMSEVTSLQSALDSKASASHGTHVAYSSTSPLMDGTASVGTASTVARSDHKHPIDTSRASQESLDSHTSNTTSHITSTERNNWNTAYTHSQTAHAPSNAEANQNAFSNVKIGDVTIAADIKTDTLTLVAGNNITLTPDATNDKITITAKDTTYTLGSFGITATAAELNKLDGVTVTTTEINYLDGVASGIQAQIDGKAASGHTHKYAGSASAGGAATSANKLNTDAGSATQPVYFTNGIPVATTYTLGKSVPSNAVFTDTHYASKNTVGATGATSNTTTSLTNGNVYLNSIENGAVTSTHKISGSGATTVTTDTSGNIIISSTDNNTTYGAAGSALGLVKSGGDVTISSGVITVNDDSHNHTIANIDNLQSSLDAKQATISGGASTITSTNLTASRALVSDSSGKVVVSAVTSTELGYLDGVTSNIQTQLDGKSPTSHTHSYAGSSSVGGSATSAVKLDTSTAGDANTPVYFTGGKPVACTSLDLNTSGSSASCTGNSATATKLQTARTIGLGTGATGTATSFNGTSNIVIPVTDVKESYLSWGGRNLSGSVSPLDAACSNLHSANRFTFAKPTGITIEYSTNGSTYSAYSTTDAAKINLVSGNGNTYYIGARSTSTTINDKLRITLNATNMGLYTRLQKLLINISTSYATGSNVIIEKAMKGSETTFTTVGTYQISGWSGWNSIPIGAAFGGGSNQTGNIAVLRLTFGITGVNSEQTSNALSVSDIIGIGDTYWSYPSTMAKTGHIYSYDSSQNATFPAKVTATTFVGALSGNAATATNVAWSGVTSKPSYYDAKAIKGITRSGTTFTYTCMDGTTGTFTQQDNNTTYSVATTSASGLMSSSDKSKLDGIDSGANKYTLPAADSSLGGVKSGGDVTISNGTITVNDDSHNHIVSNIDGLQSALDGKLSLSTGGTVNGNTVLRSSTSVSDGVMADATITSRSVVDGTSGLPTAIASMGVTNSSSVTNYGSATITANYLNEVVLNTSYLSDVSTIKLTPTKATIDTPFVSSYPSWQTIKVSHGTSGKESGFTAERTDTGTCVRFGVGAAGINHGVWSHTQNRWLIHGNANNIFIGENRAYGEKELYNNTTGTADTITLSDSAANYTYLEIHYKDNNGREFNSTKIYSPNGKSTDLFLVEAVASSTLIRRTRYNISGNKLTPDLTTAGYIQIYHNGTANKVGSETNYLRIVRVVGLV